VNRGDALESGRGMSSADRAYELVGNSGREFVVLARAIAWRLGRVAESMERELEARKSETVDIG
jgi:hypothetical protein